MITMAEVQRRKYQAAMDAGKPVSTVSIDSPAVTPINSGHGVSIAEVMEAMDWDCDMWKERDVFVIGGGSSLKDFDWSRLEDEIVISVNPHGIAHCNAACIVAMDARVDRWATDGKLGMEVERRYRNFRGLKIFSTINYAMLPSDAITVNKTDRWSNSIHAGAVTGNSGLMALNVACTLGASTVYLLGFDMKGETSNGFQKHWHDKYPQQQKSDVYLSFLKQFQAEEDNIQKFCKEHGTRIVNVGSDSALKMFDTVDELPPKRVDKPIVVSFFTLDYESLANRLERSVTMFGFRSDIRFVRDMGSWSANTSYKSKFMAEMLDAHSGKSLLWIDADAIMNRYPNMLEHAGSGKDIAVHFKDGVELLSGTLLLPNTTRVRRIVENWINRCKSNPDKWEQKHLHDAIKTDRRVAESIIVLPPQYCNIFDLINAEKPVITHYQESRQRIDRDRRKIAGKNGKTIDSAVVFFGRSVGFETALNKLGIASTHLDHYIAPGRVDKHENVIIWGGHRHKTYEAVINGLFVEGSPLNDNKLIIDNNGFHSRSSLVINKEWETVKPKFSVLQGVYNPNGHILVCLQGNDYDTTLDELPKGVSDPIVYLLSAVFTYLSDQADRIIVRIHPRKPDTYMNAVMSSGVWDKRWRINIEGGIEEQLISCAAVVTINSGAGIKAMARGVPVATLGNGIHSGSGAVLECLDPGKLRGLMKYKVDAVACSKLLTAVQQHECDKDLTDLSENTYFKEWVCGVKYRKMSVKQGRSPCMVSIMMPAYNAERYIRKAIKSVKAQTYSNWELIVVDDASTDGTADIVCQETQNDRRIKLLRISTNAGEPTCRNMALAESSGDIIAKLDADDWWNNEFLSKSVGFLIDNPTFDVVSTGMFWGEEGSMQAYPMNDGMIPHLYMSCATGAQPVNASIVGWSWVYDIVGKFDPALRYGCDGEWDIRACVAGIRFGMIKERLYYYRKYDGQLTSQNKNITAENFARIRAATAWWEASPRNTFEAHMLGDCNARCPKCSQQTIMKQMRNNASVMGIDQLTTLLERAKELHQHYLIFNITGGEPMLLRDIKDRIRIIRESGVVDSIRLFTNGIISLDGVGDLVDIILCTKRDFNAENADEIKRKYGEKATVQTSEFKTLPMSPVSETLPSLCNCRGYQLLDGTIFVCPNAAEHMERVPSMRREDYCASIDEDWVAKFRSMRRDDMDICTVCLGNRKVWSKIPS